MRRYAYEDANFVIALDRTEDISRALELTDELMTRTPYSPGDEWIGELTLTNEQAETMKAELRKEPPYDDEDFEIPVVKLYCLHLTEVIADVNKQGDEQEEPADYESILHALKDLTKEGNLRVEWDYFRKASLELDSKKKGLERVKAQYAGRKLSRRPADWIAGEKEVRAAEAKVESAKQQLASTLLELQNADLERGPRAQIIRDALVVFSVALRIDLESLAIAPFVITKLMRSLPGAPGQVLEDLKQHRALTSVTQISDLPGHAVSIKLQLERQLLVVEELVDVLTSLTATELTETAGFSLEESAVDQIVGITLDSFHANLNVEGEGFFFTQLRQEEERSTTTHEDSDGNTYTVSKDLTGRRKRLEYRVSPIWLIGVQFAAGFDWISIPEVAGVNLGFSTDRVFSTGGTIEEGSLAEELGIDGVASDFFTAGLGILGVKTSVKIANFTAGEFDVIDTNNSDGEDLNEDGIPLRIGYKQIDVGYDVSFLAYEWSRSHYIEEIYLGYKGFDYTLPRVLYELENTLGEDSRSKSFVYSRESDVQNVQSLYHLGGFRFRMGPGGAPRLHPYVALGMFFGGGPVAFEIEGDEIAGSQLAFDVNLAAGLRVRLTPVDFPVRAHAGVQWSGEALLAGIGENATDEGETTVEYDGGEMFHGVNFHLRGSL